MAKISQTFKEILQIVVFLLVVGILVISLVVYPLNRTKNIMGRPESEVLDPDSLPPNDPTLFVEAGLKADTFRIEADGLTNLACIHLAPTDTAVTGDSASAGGAIILLHDERLDRSAMLPVTAALVGAGYDVFLYDQRACGLTTGQYHSPGDYEAADLEELIAYLSIRGQIRHPFVAAGQALGADAAMLAALEESRLDAVVAVDPYLTTERWFRMLKEEHDTYWIPFSNTILWFWYELRSDYAAPYRKLDDIQPVACRTLIMTGDERLEEPEYARLREISDPDKLVTAPLTADSEELAEQIIRFASP